MFMAVALHTCSHIPYYKKNSITNLPWHPAGSSISEKC